MSRRAIGLAAYALAYVSVICGYWLLSQLVYGFGRFWFSDRRLLRGRTWRTALFEVTSPVPLAFMMGCIGLAAVTGGLAYWLVCRDRRQGKVTLAAAVSRLAMVGLAGAALDLTALGLMLAYRWFG